LVARWKEEAVMPTLSIQCLGPGPPLLVRIAAEQLARWGPLTGCSSREAYEAFLDNAARSISLPRALIAWTRLSK
jgi:hypothetical protein